MLEEWKETSIPNYFISNKGNVKTLNGKKLVLTLNGAGYYRVDLRENNKLRIASVHRLVANAFLENHENKPVVNHKDGNKLNNLYTNLEWNTYSENNKHAYDNNLNPKGSGKPNALLHEDDIPYIIELFEEGIRNNVIAKMYNVSDGTISEIRLGRTWRHVSDKIFAKSGPNPIKKLSSTDIPIIRKMIKEGSRDCDIGVIFGVARGTINQIRQGKTWTNY
jgi:hypothetical protein